MMNRLSGLVSLVLFAGSAAAQHEALPLFRTAAASVLAQEIAGELIYRASADLVHLQTPAVANAQAAALNYIKNKLAGFGLFSIQIRRTRHPHREWRARKGELWMLSPYQEKIARFREMPQALGVFSTSAEGIAELVDVGRGEHNADYEKSIVTEKLVLANGRVDVVWQKAVIERGAKGVILYPADADRENVQGIPRPRHVSIPEKASAAPGTFLFSLNARQGRRLHEILHATSRAAALSRNSGKAAQSTILLKFAIDAAIIDIPESECLFAAIPGEELLNEDIVLTATVAEKNYPPFQETSGAASLLEIARAYAKLINEGALPLPRRTIRFWWLPGEDGLSRYLRRRPEMKDSLLVNLHLGNTGDISGQTISLPPMSNASFWGAVFEALAVQMQKLHNDAYTVRRLPGGEAGNRATGVPLASIFPLLAHSGSSGLYTLHQGLPIGNKACLIFNRSVIGVPSAGLWSAGFNTFTEQEVYLQRLDPSRLQQNALLTALASWYLALFDDSQLQDILPLVYRDCLQRLSRAQTLAFQIAAGRKAAGFHLAESLLSETVSYNEAVLGSIKYIASSAQSFEIIDGFLRMMRNEKKNSQKRLKLYYSRIFERRPPKSGDYFAAEKAANELIPRNNLDLKFYLDRRHVQGTGVHPFYAEEILNFVDGQKSVLDIYHAVVAESILTGLWFFHSLTLQDVTQTIKTAAKEKLLSLQ